MKVIHDPFNIYNCYLLFISYIFSLCCNCFLFPSILIEICFCRPDITKFLNCSTKSNKDELVSLYKAGLGYNKIPVAIGSPSLSSKFSISSEVISRSNAHLYIMESSLIITILSEYLYNCIVIFEIICLGTKDCCCLCCFKCKNNGNNDQPTICHKTSVNPHYYEAKMMSLYSLDNHLCLCLISHYVLTKCIRLCMCYIMDIEMDITSVIYKNYDKYTHSITQVMSIGKMIMLIISVIYRITSWMKYRYLCTCSLLCPCCCPQVKKACSCNCLVCRQPPVKCCTCNKEKNCESGQENNNCCCKCSKQNGQACTRCCEGRCSEGQCCRCCCNCFCKSHNDQYYPYLVSIILYLSSLIENIWAMDNRGIVTVIQILSNLYSELKSYDFNSIDKIKKICCLKVCGLVVDKKCGQKDPKTCCWCVAFYNVLVSCLSLCIQFRLYKAIYKNQSQLCKNVEEFCKIEECTCECTAPAKGCCLLKLDTCLQLCNSTQLEEWLKKCCKECAGQQNGCCQKIKEKLAAGGDLLVIGCKCEPETKKEQVKPQCVIFKNPWGGRTVALVIFCKCQDTTNCCCLYKSIEKLNGESLKKLCNECQCEKLKTSLESICTPSSCCGGECPCKQLKKSLEEICKGNNDCLCKKIEELGTLCAQKECTCKAEKCCRCVCCKLAISGVRILTRSFKLNFLEPYKRITIELLSGSQTKEGIVRSIVNKINSGTLNITFLVKNNYSTHFNTYTDHKNIANRFPRLTMGYDYHTFLEIRQNANPDLMEGHHILNPKFPYRHIA